LYQGEKSLSYGGVDIPDVRAMIVIVLYNENNIDMIIKQLCVRYALFVLMYFYVLK